MFSSVGDALPAEFYRYYSLGKTEKLLQTDGAKKGSDEGEYQNKRAMNVLHLDSFKTT
jgi:hypothetical protein